MRLNHLIVISRHRTVRIPSAMQQAVQGLRVLRSKEISPNRWGMVIDSPSGLPIPQGRLSKLVAIIRDYGLGFIAATSEGEVVTEENFLP